MVAFVLWCGSIVSTCLKSLCDLPSPGRSPLHCPFLVSKLATTFTCSRISHSSGKFGRDPVCHFGLLKRSMQRRSIPCACVRELLSIYDCQYENGIKNNWYHHSPPNPSSALYAAETVLVRASPMGFLALQSPPSDALPLAVVPLGRRGTLCPCFVCCWRLLIAISGMRLRRAGRNLWGKRASGEWKRASSVEMGYTYGFPPKAQDDRLWTGT